MAKTDFTPGEKAILRNQWLIMLALNNISCNAGGTLSGMVQNQLMDRIRNMERHWDWICPPSQRH